MQLPAVNLYTPGREHKMPLLYCMFAMLGCLSVIVSFSESDRVDYCVTGIVPLNDESQKQEIFF